MTTATTTTLVAIVGDDFQAALKRAARALLDKGFELKDWQEKVFSCKNIECRNPKTGKAFESQAEGTVWDQYKGKEVPALYLVVGKTPDEVNGVLCRVKHNHAWVSGMARAKAKELGLDFDAKDKATREAARSAAYTALGTITVPLRDALRDAERMLAQDNGEPLSEDEQLELTLQAILAQETTCVLTGKPTTFGAASAVSWDVVDAFASIGSEPLKKLAALIMDRIPRNKRDERGYYPVLGPGAAEAISETVKAALGGRTKIMIKTQRGETEERSLVFPAKAMLRSIERGKMYQTAKNEAAEGHLATLGEMTGVDFSKIDASAVEAPEPPRQESRGRNDRGGNGNRGNYRGGKGGGQRRGGGYTHPRRGEDGSRR